MKYRLIRNQYRGLTGSANQSRDFVSRQTLDRLLTPRGPKQDIPDIPPKIALAQGRVEQMVNRVHFAKPIRQALDRLGVPSLSRYIDGHIVFTQLRLGLI
jgi:hypothetical protein